MEINLSYRIYCSFEKLKPADIVPSAGIPAEGLFIMPSVPVVGRARERFPAESRINFKYWLVTVHP
jgi:hypothetical protein